MCRLVLACLFPSRSRRCARVVSWAWHILPVDNKPYLLGLCRYSGTMSGKNKICCEGAKTVSCAIYGACYLLLLAPVYLLCEREEKRSSKWLALGVERKKKGKCAFVDVVSSSRRQSVVRCDRCAVVIVCAFVIVIVLSLSLARSPSPLCCHCCCARRRGRFIRALVVRCTRDGEVFAVVM